MEKQEVMAKIKGGLIVSCQARVGWPMYGADIMAAFSRAAEIGGAVGIRATAPENIRAIRKVTQLPIIGIYKQWYEGYDVYITPVYKAAEEIIAAGADIVALDGTARRRPQGETFADIVARIHRNYPHIPIMADCATVEEAKRCAQEGADIVSSTLRGYTEETSQFQEFCPGFIRELADATGLPVIAEGHIMTPEQAAQALDNRAFAVVVGTAITRPEVITRRFVESMKDR